MPGADCNAAASAWGRPAAAGADRTRPVRHAPALDEPGAPPAAAAAGLRSRCNRAAPADPRGPTTRTPRDSAGLAGPPATWRMWGSPRLRAESPPGEPRTKDAQHRCDQSPPKRAAPRVLSDPTADPKRGLTLGLAAQASAAASDATP